MMEKRNSQHIEQIKSEFSEQMKIQNENREKEILATINKTKAELQHANAKEKYAVELKKKRLLEEKKIKLIEQVLQEVIKMIKIQEKLIYDKFPTLSVVIKEQTRILEVLLELEKIIISRIMVDTNDNDTKDRLTDILKSFGEKNTSINFTPGDVNIGTNVKGDAGDINVAESNSIATQTKKREV